MATTHSRGSQKPQNYLQNNPLETFKGVSGSIAKNSAKAFGDIGAGIGNGMLDALTGKAGENFAHKENQSQSAEQPSTFKKKTEFKTLFDFREQQEIQMIKELTKKSHEEVMALKKANAIMAEEVKDIEKLTINAMPDKPGVYHIRFLEIVLSILRTLRAKIGESSTWLQALSSKKKKRGSAFSQMAKKKGTQFSLSQELQLARNGQ
jgi:hypothetical protein